MKYPLDLETVNAYFSRLVAHEIAQQKELEKLLGMLQDVLDVTDEDFEMVGEIERVLREHHALRMDHDNRKFNERNAYRSRGMTIPVDTPVNPEEPIKLEEPKSEGEMSEEELARHFQEPRPKRKKAEKSVSKMTLEEIEEWEKKQDNSTDIYKVAARVKNLARGGGGLSLTPAGEALCNSFVHMAKEMYDFAETIQDKDTKIKLIELVRKNENVPATLIAALGAGRK